MLEGLVGQKNCIKAVNKIDLLPAFFNTLCLRSSKNKKESVGERKENIE